MTESNSWGGALTWRQLQALNAAGGPGRTEAQLLASGALSETNSWGGPITLRQNSKTSPLVEGDSWGGPLTWRQLNALGGAAGGKITLRQLQAAGVPVEGDAWGGMVTLRQYNAVGSPVLGDPLYSAAQQVPVFDLRFEVSGTIVDAIGAITPTFTRPSSVKNVWNGSAFVEVLADVPGFQANAGGRRGYLHEPAATNLFLNTAAPVTRSITVTAVQHTLSFYGTGTITLSGASTAGPLVGTGAEPNRVSLTFTPTAGSLTLTLSGTIVRPQLETGPVATSPITTAANTVTRASDVMTVSGADFTSIWDAAGTVMYCEYTALHSAVSGQDSGLWSVNNDVFGRGWGLRMASDTVLSLVSRHSGGTNFIDFGGVAHPGGPHKAAAFIRLADSAMSANGSAVTTNATGLVLSPAVSQLQVGLQRMTGGTARNPVLIHRLAMFSSTGPASTRLQQMAT